MILDEKKNNKYVFALQQLEACCNKNGILISTIGGILQFSVHDEVFTLVNRETGDYPVTFPRVSENKRLHAFEINEDDEE